MADWEVKQGTTNTIPFGPFVSTTTSGLLLDALTITQADVELSKNGGAFAQKNEASNSAHMGDAYYAVVLDDTDSGTRGTILAKIIKAGAFPVDAKIAVLSPLKWNAKYGDDAPDFMQAAVWLDTVNGDAANSGTHRSPMDTIANALTKLASTGLSRLGVLSNQTVILGASISAKEIFGFGRNGIIDLNGQDISYCTFRDLLVYNDSLSASGPAEFIDCTVGTGTYAQLYARNCVIYGVLGINGQSYLTNCTDQYLYSTAPAIDFETPGTARRAVMNNYHGRIETRNMNANAYLLLTGIGQITIAATCTGGTIQYMGLWDVVDNSGGAVTLTKIDDDTLSSLSNLGTGPYTVTLTFEDSDTSDPIQGVSVRMRASAAEDLRGVTDVNGQVTFYPMALTYTITATLSNYTLDDTPVTLAVSGDATPTAYTMTANTITPSSGSYTTAFTKTYAPDGTVEGSVSVTCIPIAPPSGSVGIIFDATPLVATSDASTGIVQFANRVKGARYRFYRGENDLGIEWTIPLTAGDTYELPSFTGKP